ncbi:MAG: type IV pilin protein [Planctomycetota bacterium]
MSGRRKGFTLIELLVVIAIIALFEMFVTRPRIRCVCRDSSNGV